jgi:5'-methylthioadenosine phosphorylase
MESVEIGVLGGSGLYNMEQLTDKVTYDIETPLGKPSAPVVVGTLSGQRVAFIPRHGVGHVYTPTTIPYRQNLLALKMMGVRFVVAVSACGSLREDYAPGHIAIPEQLVDFTKSERGRTFFDTGLVGHVGVADPFDTYLSDLAFDALQSVGATVHKGGTFITIEGPRFSTRGESRIFQSWGCDLIGMTTSPEAFLAAEAQMAYACMAHVTDYDVWHTSEEPVTVEMVMATAKHNIELVQNALVEMVANVDTATVRPVHSSLDYAVMTAPDATDNELRDKLAAILGR